MKKVFNKFLYCLIIFMVLFNYCGGLLSYAVEINSADLEAIGSADYHLKYYREDTDSYRYLICTIVGYHMNDNFYPAYCMNCALDGVTPDNEYSVSINEIINRDDVWRVVKNGYPYKSPEEMGLENEFDAFAVTKFATYCVLGEATLEKFYAEPDDLEAVAMLNALYNLVNIGLNGNESREAGNYSINKNGDLVEEGNYYYQNYSISSNLDMKETEIIIESGLPEGAFVTKIDDYNFRLYILKSSFNSDISGTLKIIGKSRTYPIFYGESGNPNTQDYVLTYDTFGSASSSCIVNFSAMKGKIKVKKIDESNNLPISGVEFELRNKDGTFKIGGVTDSNGVLYFENLIPGDYYIKEIKTNENYILDNKDITVLVKANETTEISIKNKSKEGQIKIVKVDSDNNEIKIEGVEFKVYDEKGNIVDEIKTDKNGEAITKKLKINHEYTIKEVKTNQNYKLNEKQVKVKLTDERIKTVTIENDYKEGQIKIVKVDSDNNEIKIEGVEFKVYDEKGNVVDELKTDKNGEAITKKLKINHNYTIKETKTLNNYVLNDKPIVIKLDKDQIENVFIENELKKGKIKIIKVDKDNNEIKLEGVCLKVFDEEKNLVEELKTDKNGEAISKDLRIDKKYYVYETKTNDNYILDEEPKEIKLQQNQITDLILENEHKKGNLIIYKIDKDNNKITLGNVEFALYSQEFNKIISTYRTDVNGEIKIDNLRIGNYTLIEKETGRWYNLAEDKEIKIEWDNITESFIENELQKCRIKVIKIDKDNKEIKLKGVKFDVKDNNGNILETIETDEFGEAITSKYSIRDYDKITIVEKETLNNYKLDSKPQTIELKANQIIDVVFENEVKKGKIKVIKVDKDNKEIKLKDVKFGIYNSKNELLETIVTDFNGEAITNDLPISEKYTIKELETGADYELDSKEIVIELKEDEIKSIVFENELKKGEIELIKLDKDTKKVLKDIEFELYDFGNNIIGKYKTDKDGKIVVKGLKIGDYYFKETKTLNEYELKEEKIKCIVENKKVTKLKVYNEVVNNRFKIIKIDKDDKNKKLEGVEFEVLDEEGNLLEKLVTDKNGEAVSSYYPIKNKVYTVHEIKTLDGYQKNDEYISFKLNKKNVKEVTIKNEKVKIDKKSEIPKEEVKVEKKEEIKKEEEKVLPRTGY